MFFKFLPEPLGFEATTLAVTTGTHLPFLVEPMGLSLGP
jgi:hypothetical protein